MCISYPEKGKFCVKNCTNGVITPFFTAVLSRLSTFWSWETAGARTCTEKDRLDGGAFSVYSEEVSLQYASRAAEGLARRRCGNLPEGKVPIPAPRRWRQMTIGVLQVRHRYDDAFFCAIIR